jgi:hypothetical protein
MHLNVNIINAINFEYFLYKVHSATNDIEMMDFEYKEEQELFNAKSAIYQPFQS